MKRRMTSKQLAFFVVLSCGIMIFAGMGDGSTAAGPPGAVSVLWHGEHLTVDLAGFDSGGELPAYVTATEADSSRLLSVFYCPQGGSYDMWVGSAHTVIIQVADRSFSVSR